jgi:Radical SAM superfamily
MFIRPRVLSILTTRRCTAACDHCCVGASPRAKDAIPIERIHGLIDEAKRIPSIERIVFTGGECFLLGKELDALIAHAHDAGFATRVISNSYWATSDEAATRRLSPLRTSGLDEMMLSTGSFHQRFVPVERVIFGARAANLLGIPTLISVESCDQSEFDCATLFQALEAEVSAGGVRIASTPWIPDAGGRSATPITHHRLLEERSTTEYSRCVQILDVISVTPRQMLTACCGYPLEELDNLRIGSVKDRSLDQVLCEAPNGLLHMWLQVSGPSEIARFVAQHVPGYELPEFASICEACSRLQRDDQAMRAIAEHASTVAQDITTQFVSQTLRRIPTALRPVAAT